MADRALVRGPEIDPAFAVLAVGGAGPGHGPGQSLRGLVLMDLILVRAFPVRSCALGCIGNIDVFLAEAQKMLDVALSHDMAAQKGGSFFASGDYFGDVVAEGEPNSLGHGNTFQFRIVFHCVRPNRPFPHLVCSPGKGLLMCRLL